LLGKVTSEQLLAAATATTLPLQAAALPADAAAAALAAAAAAAAVAGQSTAELVQSLLDAVPQQGQQPGMAEQLAYLGFPQSFQMQPFSLQPLRHASLAKPEHAGELTTPGWAFS
jgi:predicted secreted Zn-dependent protease